MRKVIVNTLAAFATARRLFIARDQTTPNEALTTKNGIKTERPEQTAPIPPQPENKEESKGQ